MNFVVPALMAGVVGMMLIFAIIAAIGYVRKPKED